MSSYEQTLQMVLKCAEELNAQIAAEKRIELSADAALLGDGRRLDSLGLVTLCVNVEQSANEKLGISCAVLDELMNEQDPHPFMTIAGLAKWISEQA